MTNNSITFNRFGYGAFVLLAIYYISKGDYLETTSTLGIALIFDPFNQATPFNQRPKWQQAWLVVHLMLVFASLIYGII